MKLKMKHLNMRLLSLVLLMLCSLPVLAQPEMAEGMRAEGKIYVVVAIIVIILAGMIFYLFTLDRKLTRLERRFQDNRKN